MHGPSLASVAQPIAHLTDILGLAGQEELSGAGPAGVSVVLQPLWRVDLGVDADRIEEDVAAIASPIASCNSESRGRLQGAADIAAGGEEEADDARLRGCMTSSRGIRWVDGATPNSGQRGWPAPSGRRSAAWDGTRKGWSPCLNAKAPAAVEAPHLLRSRHQIAPGDLAYGERLDDLQPVLPGDFRLPNARAKPCPQCTLSEMYIASPPTGIRAAEPRRALTISLR